MELAGREGTQVHPPKLGDWIADPALHTLSTHARLSLALRPAYALIPHKQSLRPPPSPFTTSQQWVVAVAVALPATSSV